MNKKLVRIFIVFLELLSVITVLTFCIQGLANKSPLEIQFKFIESILRCVFISVFAFFYYFSFSKNFESSGIFMPLYIMFDVISEFRIAEDLSRITNTIIIPPEVQNYLFLFANIMMALSLIGFCVFYDFSDQKTVNRYVLISIAVGAITTYLLPKQQTIMNIWDSGIILYFTILMFAVCGLTCLIVILTNLRDPNLIRHFAALLFIVSNYINLFYDTFLMNIIGTVVFAAACLLIIIVSKINEVRL